ncbi:MAG: hypothetical protein ACI4EA_09190 [Candidatus Ornithomonoglobus sp.]
MKVDLRFPPFVSGSNRSSIGALSDTLCALIKRLKVILINLDDSNITELSAGKINGQLDMSKVSIGGGTLTLRPGYFKLENSDGSQFIELDGENINLSVNSINAVNVDSDSVTAKAYGGLPDAV